ncbi:MAG: type IX secretion system outer membrane channel protein PorV [Crocinitomicaceae bacterium]|jgi:hypothetical protein
MKNIIKGLLIVIPFFIKAQTNQEVNKALQMNAITTTMPFLSINPDTRSGGMGDAGTALSPTCFSSFWNTAGIVFSEKNNEVGIAFIPWLRQLNLTDMNLSYLSGYKKIGDRQAFTAGLRFFNLGSITFTDISGQKIKEDKPSEFELLGGYAFKLTDKFSIGLNGKFVYSNLTGGQIVAGAQTKAGIAGGADISMLYHNEDLNVGGKSAAYNFGLTINNIANKVSYSPNGQGDFVPINLKIGNAFTSFIDKYNAVTVSVDLQKLLVPTPPIYNLDRSKLIAGKDNNLGVVAGMLQSFYDAPGQIAMEGTDTLFNDDKTAQIVKGSVFKEEMREINIGTGIEYDYNKTFAVRGGYFHESATKGNRQFFTFGVGLKYQMLQIDLSYIATVQRNNPLANTIRYSVRLNLGNNK